MNKMHVQRQFIELNNNYLLFTIEKFKVLYGVNIVLQAYQTFEVIVKIGCKHDLSAGLVIGGKVLEISSITMSVKISIENRALLKV